MMLSEWLRVMLEEIARKNAEVEQAKSELAQRPDEQKGARTGNDRDVG